MTATSVLDGDLQRPAASPRHASEVRDWTRLAGVLLARIYRTFVLGLVVIAVAPVVLGWGSYVVRSGSMEPSIRVGDVVVAKPWADDHRVRVGRVFVYDDPATTRPHLMVHRVVELRDDGDYTTAGDANELTDVTPLPRSDIRATAVLLVPHAGLPVTWLQAGRWLPLAAWLLVTVAAFALATRRLDGEPPRWRLLRILRDRFTSRPPPDGPSSSGGTEPGPPPRDGVRRSRTPLLAVASLVVVGTLASTASAGFTGHTRNSGSDWTAGSWTQPYVTAVLADRPYGFWLLDETSGQYASDRSGNDRTGQYYGNLALGTPGGLPRNPGTAIDNAGGRAVLGTQAVAAPSAYSIELWFRTTARTQAYLAGFEDDRDDNWRGAAADRIVSMTPSGHITFGTWKNGDLPLTTAAPYNDGAWHHLVVTSTPSRFSTVYVDGVRVVSGTSSYVESYPGYWRVGQGSTGNQNGFTASFTGDLDNVAIYHSTLPATRVAAHWAAR
ncbi:signal peptidase I [Nocardioides sp. S5]|uniref:signal peptidase I n=1 Tax=Nocardioides sp. S5 TaxID=2017486 RepID=UPI001A8D9647|nr:signal peptidase I [Nocardioides sp. S5]